MVLNNRKPKGLFKESLGENTNINVLMSKMANEWLSIGSKIKDPKPLFGNFWHQGEVGILFSNTGKGKSILAVQIADAISNGSTVLQLESENSKILYFDFELSTKSFQKRYSIDNNTSYIFSENFIRVEIDRTKSFLNADKSFEELIIESIKAQLLIDEPEVIIIDNITFLSASNEKSQEAMALMKLILDISRKKRMSILLIAHTPKRDIYKPIQLEDLAGSKALSNFVDFCFCIGESTRSDDIRYIKELKNRNHPMRFGAKNVLNCKIVKDDCFLKFDFLGFGRENDHLKIDTDISQNEKYQEVKLLKSSGKTNVEISEIYGCSEKTIRRWLEKVDM